MSETPAKALIAQTRPFVEENTFRSWLEVAVTFSLLIGGYALLWTLPGVWLRLALAPVVGLLLVRAFILFHDFQHVAILRGSKIANAIFYIYGLWVLTPPEVWRYTHNYHHANTAKMVGSHIGSYPTVSVDIYNSLPRKQQIKYAAMRHPLTILFGYFTVFHLGMCIGPFFRNPRGNVSCVLAVTLHLSAMAAVYYFFGGLTVAVGFLLPMMIAHAAGGYLFYVQHNCEGIHIQPRNDWDYARAALESSSYLETGPIMRWFTGNIGYHHVHHLNPRIPFYRLPETMSSIEALQEPRTTSLHPKEIWSALRLKLWDPKAGKMVGFPRRSA